MMQAQFQFDEEHSDVDHHKRLDDQVNGADESLGNILPLAVTVLCHEFPRHEFPRHEFPRHEFPRHEFPRHEFPPFSALDATKRTCVEYART